MYTNTINPYEFYKTYHGHSIEHLTELLYELKSLDPSKKIVYLVGDSSLDNKYWLPTTYVPALNNYENILKPKLMKPDVNYHLNSYLQESPYVAVNVAVE